MGITKQLSLEELEKSKELTERIKKQQETEEENYLINKIKKEVKKYKW